MFDTVVRKYDNKDVIIGCSILHSSNVSIFYFKYAKNKKNELRFNFILN